MKIGPRMYNYEQEYVAVEKISNFKGKKKIGRWLKIGPDFIFLAIFALKRRFLH